MELLKKYYSWIITVITFIVYLFTLAPSVVQIDSGELAAVQSTLGIAHPTGYPLFTMLGYLFVQLPLPFSNIFMSNLLSAIFCSAGIFIFTKSLHLILTNSFVAITTETEKLVKGKSKKKHGREKLTELVPLTDLVIYSGIFAGSLILAFSKTFWFQSTSVEVYSLHILLINLIIYFVLKAFVNENEGIKKWLIVAAVLALGFSNHMTTLLVIPGLAYIYFMKESFSKDAVIRIGYMLLLFFPLLIIIYSYLPIRAAMAPALNWGNPVDYEHFMRHFMGKQYQVWLFSSFDAAGKQFNYFVTNYASEFSYAGLLLILPGIFYSFKLNKHIARFLLVTFLFTVLYSINYDINDIDSYFLLAYIVSGVWATFGIAFILTRLKNIKREFILAGLAVVILLNAGINFTKSDQSDVYIYEDYTKAVMNSVEDDAIIIGYQWDYWLSASYYYQNVEGVKPNITVIDKELLRRSWYYDQLKNASPNLFDGVENNVYAFLDALVPFERGGKYNSQKLETNYQAIMTGLVQNQIATRPIYLGPELVQNEFRNRQFVLPQGYKIVPHQLMFKVVPDTNTYFEAGIPEFSIRYPEEDNFYTGSIKRIVKEALLQRAIYEKYNNKPEKSELYINKYKTDFPDAPISAKVKQILNLK